MGITEWNTLSNEINDISSLYLELFVAANDQCTYFEKDEPPACGYDLAQARQCLIMRLLKELEFQLELVEDCVNSATSKLRSKR